MSFFDGEACPDDNLKGLLSIHLKLGEYIHYILKIWKSLDFGIDWLRNGRVIKRPARDACLCMGELQAPPAPPAPHFVFLITL